MRPKWLELPVEHKAISEAEADLLMILAARQVEGWEMDPVERAAVAKLQQWSALALLETTGMVPQ